MVDEKNQYLPQICIGAQCLTVDFLFWCVLCTRRDPFFEPVRCGCIVLVTETGRKSLDLGPERPSVSSKVASQIPYFKCVTFNSQFVLPWGTNLCFLEQTHQTGVYS